MSRNDLNMEDLFRSRMESYTVDPSPGLWQKVHAKILWKQFFGFSFQTFNVYYLAAALSLAGLGTYALLTGTPDMRSESQVQTIGQAGSDIRSELPEEASGPESMEQAESIPAGTGEKAGAAETAAAQDKHAGQVKKEEPATQPVHDLKSTDKPELEESPLHPEDQAARKSESLVVRADFNPNHSEGCLPLAVQFENLSENALRSDWIFGDGGSSTEENPSYVFDEPGEFQVILKITGRDGLEYSAQQTITVFETPKALFEMDDDVDLSDNQPVYFYNYSRGADYYEWDFGDQHRSELSEPVHYYEKPGSYNIKLKAWNVHHCYDSLVILNAFSGTGDDIRFPNAFTPNMTGPTGGYYEVNDINNTVFHPVVSGELIEYQLKIFNRQGLLVFESKDVFTGWDGYYQETLAAQAVYIWKARGKFSNGKTFVKSGDVTLLRQY